MAAITAAVIAAGGAAYNIIQGANAKAEANQAAASAAQSIAQMQEADKFKNLQVPTLGLEMAQQNVQARQAQQLQGLQDIGAAGVLGGLTALNTQGRAEDLALSAQAQQAQYARDMAQAENAQAVEQRNLARQANLEQQRLMGAQAAAAAGQQSINSGIQGLAQTAGNVLVQSLQDQPLYKPEDTVVAGTKNQELYNAQQLSNQMYNRGQQVLKTSIPTGLQAIPNINVLNPQQLQNNYMNGLRASQGQYDSFLGLNGLMSPLG